MITKFNKYPQNTSEPFSDEQENVKDEHSIAFTPKICCLESYWNQGMVDSFSMKPYLKSIGWMLEKDIITAYRHISSGKDLTFYVKYPDGMIWKDSRLRGIDVFYIAAHGKPGGLMTTVKDIESDELISVFNGLDRYNNIVYFGACEVFKGEKGKRFAQDFLRKTGTLAVIGYSDLTSFIEGLVIDTLFLARFFETKGNKFDQLQEIYDAVMHDYPRAKRCGFSIFLNEKNS